MITDKRIFQTESGNVIGVVDSPHWLKRAVGSQPMVRIGLIDPKLEHPGRPPVEDFRVVTASLLKFLETTSLYLASESGLKG